MDTISGGNNSMLPLGGIIVGAVALLLGGYSAISLSKVKATVAAHDEKLSKVDDIAASVDTANKAAAKANSDLQQVASDTNKGFTTLEQQIASLKADMAKAEEVRKPAAKGTASKEPVTAGPGEYIVKAGDTGVKIASAVGCKLSELEAVNPGVDWTKIKPGQKLKLPSGAKSQ